MPSSDDDLAAAQAAAKKAKKQRQEAKKQPTGQQPEASLLSSQPTAAEVASTLPQPATAVKEHSAEPAGGSINTSTASVVPASEDTDTDRESDSLPMAPHLPSSPPAASTQAGRVLTGEPGTCAGLSETADSHQSPSAAACSSVAVSTECTTSAADPANAAAEAGSSLPLVMPVSADAEGEAGTDMQAAAATKDAAFLPMLFCCPITKARLRLGQPHLMPCGNAA